MNRWAIVYFFTFKFDKRVFTRYITLSLKLIYLVPAVQPPFYFQVFIHIYVLQIYNGICAMHI